ncbi:MAG: CHASE domain-containing protein [Alphaproteobacteria bacterium]|nr:CHASE domain-containing protein [Alphaproteobacteria bacterium]
MPPASHRLRRLAVASLVLAVGVVVAAVAYLTARSADERRVEEQLEFRAAWRVDDIEYKLHSSFSILIGAASTIAAEGPPTSERLDRFVRARISYGATAPDSVFWAPRVPHAERRAFEEAMRGSGAADFAIREVEVDASGRAAIVPARERPDYYPAVAFAVQGLRPPDVGLDSASAGLSAALQHSIDSARVGVAGLSSPGPHGDASAPGITVFLPVYEPIAPPAEARRAAVRGVVGAAFDLVAVLNGAIEGTPAVAGPIFVLRSVDTAGGRATAAAVYDPARGSFAASAADVTFASLAGYHTFRQFTLGGTTWRLLLLFPPEQVAALRTSAPLAWLALSVLLSLAAAAAALAGIGRGERLRNIIDERTGEVARLDAELRHRLADLEAIVGASPMAIVTTGTDGAIRTISPAAERILGISAAHEVGTPIAALARSDADAAAIVARALGGESIAGIETAWTRPDGTIFDARISASPLRYATSPVAGAVLLVEDVTEQKATAEQLMHAQKLESVGQLTGGVAHDFNNLLAIIMGNLELLSDRGLNDDKRERLLQPAMRATLRGAELTQQLLAFSRRQTLRPVPTQLDRILPPLRNMMARTLGETIDLQLILAPDLATCIVDPGQLENAILNLAINARDAMPQGGKIVIEAHNAVLDKRYAEAHFDVREGRYIVVSVSDEGRGMTKDVQARAFEPFFTTKEVGKGSGLGLSMVYGFAKQSGGNLTLYSEPGHGTTIKLYLPQVETAAAALPELPQRRPEESFSGTVLVVEDQPDVRATAIEQFATLGFSALAAGTGQEALAILQERDDVKLLFCDVVLGGGMNGPALATAATRIRPGLTVLYTSGYTKNAIVHHGRLDEGVNLINKPYRRADLIRAVKAALDGA